MRCSYSPFLSKAVVVSNNVLPVLQAADNTKNSANALGELRLRVQVSGPVHVGLRTASEGEGCVSEFVRIYRGYAGGCGCGAISQPAAVQRRSRTRHHYLQCRHRRVCVARGAYLVGVGDVPRFRLLRFCISHVSWQGAARRRAWIVRSRTSCDNSRVSANLPLSRLWNGRVARHPPIVQNELSTDVNWRHLRLLLLLP